MQLTDDQTSRSKISRRSFLGLTLFGVLGLFLAQSLVALLRFLKPLPSSGFGGLVYAGEVDEFPVGSVNHVLKGRFYLVHTEDGFLALWQRCTHLGCSVPWEEAENDFHCPCHGSTFDYVGVVTGGPAPRPLDFFPILIENGEIWVDTGDPIKRTQYDVDQVTSV